MFFVLTFACKKEKPHGRVIAMVGDEVLTLSELLDEFPKHIRSQLSSVDIREYVLLWINDQVLYQEACSRNIDESPQLKREFEKLRRELVVNKLLEITLDKGITATDDEIQAYYEANKEAFELTEETVRANHLLLTTQREANEVRKRLRDGEDFGAVARSIGGDSLSTAEWDLGYFTKDDVIPEIADVVFKMAINSYSYPIKSEFGYHIVQLLDRQKKGDIKRLESVKDEIRHKLITKKKKDKYQRFLLQMKSKFKIQTNFQLLDSSKIDTLLQKGD